ncbi:hypothetical protein EV356DRAFT_531101 [Viridothelium virens]|uniref:Protein kinase domain-containing protein n=1 Tax=Viridothelium virens TaxID=1048519 RepID=A0A6A6HG36_VIRVR|nr:hypothetical protein EV356DRAFT_531101 [Viridothelium virens]
MTLESIKEHQQEIRDALHKIKEAGYTHNDIHQNNIMWDPATKHPKIIDFGEARKVDEKTPLTDDGCLSKRDEDDLTRLLDLRPQIEQAPTSPTAKNDNNPGQDVSDVDRVVE